MRYVFVKLDQPLCDTLNLNVREFTEQPTNFGDVTADSWFIFNAGQEPVLTETQYVSNTELVLDPLTKTATVSYSVSTKSTEMLLKEEYLANSNIDVTKKQFRLALLSANILETVENNITGVTKIYYEESSIFNSHDDRLITAAINLNLSAAVVNSIFENALTY